MEYEVAVAMKYAAHMIKGFILLHIAVKTAILHNSLELLHIAMQYFINKNLASREVFSSFLHCCLYQHPVAVVDFVLDDLRAPALEVLGARLESFSLPLHFDFFVALTGARRALQRKAAFFGVKGL